MQVAHNPGGVGRRSWLVSVMGAEGIEQKRKERVHASDCRALGYQAGSEPAAFESIEQRTAARDHMNRHVPRSALAAHSGGRLVISDKNHDEIAIGPVPECVSLSAICG